MFSKDVKQGGVDRKTGTELYFDIDQTWRVPNVLPNSLNFVLRTTRSPETLAGSVHQAVAALDPAVPVIKLRSMDDVFDEAIGRPRLLAELLGMFAGLALLLAAIGSYGVLAYMVTERRREIGIRMALGADRASVLQMVLGQGLRLTVAGVAIGLAVAVAVNRLLASLLYGVAPIRPAHDGDGRRNHGRGRGRCLLPAGARRDARRSDDRPPRRIAGRTRRGSKTFESSSLCAPRSRCRGAQSSASAPRRRGTNDQELLILPCQSETVAARAS